MLVFAGVASALGFSWWGMLASVAAIVALLYAGGVWFGAPPPSDSAVVLFTHTLVVASGPHTGRPLTALYPHANRTALEDGCRKGLAGHASRFTCDSQRFAVSPVRSAEGAVVYGLLLSGAAAAAEASAVTPVA